MKPKVDHTVKKQRTHILIEQGMRKKYTYYEQHLGRTGLVLFEQQLKNGNWAGYTSNYMNVEAPSPQNLHNKMCEVRFVSADEHRILAEIIETDKETTK
jgi:tRNA A37 methylthiotransferase MiaB